MSRALLLRSTARSSRVVIAAAAAARKQALGPRRAQLAAAAKQQARGCPPPRLIRAMAGEAEGGKVLPDGPPKAPGFNVRKEEVAYKRYLTVYSREIQFPTRKEGEERVYDFDIVGHPRSEFHFTVAFPFHPGGPGDGSVTLVKEYAQGLDTMIMSLPTGGYEPAKHTSLEECARAELSEEAHLCGGEMARLVPEGHPGFAEVKWCRNRFTPFVVVAPEADATPGGRDDEEHDMQIVRVTVEELRGIILDGSMGLPSMTTCHLALDYLKQHGHIQ